MLYRATNAKFVDLLCTNNASHTRVVVCPHHRRRLRHRRCPANARSLRNYGSSEKWAEMQQPTNWNPAKMAPICCAFVQLDNRVSNMKPIMLLVSSKLERTTKNLF